LPAKKIQFTGGRQSRHPGSYYKNTLRFLHSGGGRAVWGEKSSSQQELNQEGEVATVHGGVFMREHFLFLDIKFKK
jgi:hypothetical protein